MGGKEKGGGGMIKWTENRRGLMIHQPHVISTKLKYEVSLNKIKTPILNMRKIECREIGLIQSKGEKSQQ